MASTWSLLVIIGAITHLSINAQQSKCTSIGIRIYFFALPDDDLNGIYIEADTTRNGKPYYQHKARPYEMYWSNEHWKIEKMNQPAASGLAQCYEPNPFDCTKGKWRHGNSQSEAYLFPSSVVLESFSSELNGQYWFRDFYDGAPYFKHESSQYEIYWSAADNYHYIESSGILARCKKPQASLKSCIGSNWSILSGNSFVQDADAFVYYCWSSAYQVSNPSTNPTNAPTLSPTNVPTYFSNEPITTETPSTIIKRTESTYGVTITNNPTYFPTFGPSTNPTSTPTTPYATMSPVFIFICGDEREGEYNGGILQFFVQTTFKSDITFDASLSTFDIANIEAYTQLSDKLIASDSDNDGILILENYPAGNYRFFVGANGGISGTFVISTKCESHNPTPSPTNIPSSNPTDAPTSHPTLISQQSTEIKISSTAKKLLQSTSKVNMGAEEGNNSNESGILSILLMVGLILLFSLLIGCCIVYKMKVKNTQNKNHKMVEISVKEHSTCDIKNVMKVDNEFDELDKQSVAMWLRSINMDAYFQQFVDNGYTSLKAVKTIETTGELEEIGLNVIGHRSLMMVEIEKLRLQNKITKGITAQDNNLDKMQTDYSLDGGDNTDSEQLFGTTPHEQPVTNGEGDYDTTNGQ